MTYETRGPSVSPWPYFNLGSFPKAALPFLSPCLPLCSAKRHRALVMRPKEGGPSQVHVHGPVFPWSPENCSGQPYMECAWPLRDLVISREQSPFRCCSWLELSFSKGAPLGKSVTQGQVTAREVYLKGCSLGFASANCKPSSPLTSPST